MDRRKQRFKKRTAVTKEQALNFLCAVRETAKRSRSPAGPRRLGTATRMSASLFRRLSAFFGSAPGQDPKAAKFAVLIPGRAGFPNRAKRSEGSDTTPTQKCRKNAKRELLSPPPTGLPPKPSEAVSVGRGRATERASPAACGGTRDSSSARTTASIAFVWSAAKPLPCQTLWAGHGPTPPSCGQKPTPTFSYDWRKT